MNKWLNIIIGTILLIIGILVWYFSATYWGEFWNFGEPAWELLKGGLLWLIIFIGLILLILGISDLKD
jgi:TRAP-type C4-dicarboxylate transport system permease small subunit